MRQDDVAFPGRFLEVNAIRIAPDPNSGCWLWLGAWDFPSGGQRKSALVYGRMRYMGRQARPHRVAHIMDCGPIPDGMVVRHKCDNPVCVNPDHLELGTHQDNVNDMIDRGRIRGKKVAPPTFVKPHGLIGERNGRAKLTASDIAQIRALRSQGESCQSVAEKFGLSKSYVSKVARGVRWLQGLPTVSEPPQQQEAQDNE